MFGLFRFSLEKCAMVNIEQIVFSLDIRKIGSDEGICIQNNKKER